MDASTAAGALGTGLVTFLVLLVCIGLLSSLAIGALARWVLPGPDPMSWLRTIGYGLAGSFLGGILARMLGASSGIAFLLSIACAAGLIWYFTRRGRVSPPPSSPPPPTTPPA